MTVSHALKRLVERQRFILAEHLTGAVEEGGEESLHRCRVSTRRLRAVLSLCRNDMLWSSARAAGRRARVLGAEGPLDARELRERRGEVGPLGRLVAPHPPHELHVALGRGLGLVRQDLGPGALHHLDPELGFFSPSPRLARGQHLPPVTGSREALE